MTNLNAFIHRLPGYFLRNLLLLLPTGLLTIAAIRDGYPINWALWLGVGFQLTVCVLSSVSNRSWQQPIGPSIITLYLIALAWLWSGIRMDDWYAHFSRACTRWPSRGPRNFARPFC